MCSRRDWKKQATDKASLSFSICFLYLKCSLKTMLQNKTFSRISRKEYLIMSFIFVSLLFMYQTKDVKWNCHITFHSYFLTHAMFGHFIVHMKVFLNQQVSMTGQAWIWKRMNHSRETLPLHGMMYCKVTSTNGCYA